MTEATSIGHDMRVKLHRRMYQGIVLWGIAIVYIGLYSSIIAGGNTLPYFITAMWAFVIAEKFRADTSFVDNQKGPSNEIS